MMRKTVIYPAMLITMLASVASAATVTGDQVVASVKKAFAVVKDYRVDAKITVKGSNINISNMPMTIYYKKPDKIHVQAKDGAAVVPKGTMIGNPIEELTRGSKVSYVKAEKKNGVDCHVIKITGNGQPPMTVWVDKKHHVITATQNSGDFSVNTTWRYKMVDGKYYLPVEVSATTQIPGGQGMRHGPKPAAPASSPEQVKMVVSFSNYAVNKGIDDKIFVEKPRK